ncbi:MAG: hypothetical protein JXN62_01585 [Bacteroidales bacterium]|nr:hypothetical protein [Bacteroidales bacterium]
MKYFYILCFLLLLAVDAFAQTVINPNYGLKSHETLFITRIEATSKTTTFYMSVENRIQKGTFCADRNIFLIYPDGTRSRLISAHDIPVCPDTYKFNTIGERLEFTLTFPAFRKGIKCLDLVEDCSENCFSFYGIVVDSDLNTMIDEAFELAENGESARAIISFTDLLEATDPENRGIEGLLYVNIIRLADRTGNPGQAAQFYRKFKSSGVPMLNQYIEFLNDLGIKY